MRAIHRLLINDLYNQWRQGIAITALLACGVATFVMMTSTMRSVQESQQRYYRDYRFADVFMQLTRAPDYLASRVSALPGVVHTQTRIVEHAIISMPEMVEPVSCRLISMEEIPSHGLNGVHLRAGTFPAKASRMEVVVHELFAEAHGIRPGDKIDVILGGHQKRLTVSGIGMSPEYVYAVQPGLLVPDNRRFGIIWMPRKSLAAAFDMDGAFNDLSLKLANGTNLQQVLFQVDRIFEPYGGRGAYPAADQESHSRVADELHQMQAMAYVTPSIFMIVAAFLFNVVLSRMVKQQQEQIATLRAFGYSANDIGRHYFRFLLVFVIAGCLAGCAIGVRLSWWMIDLYGKYFRFPEITFLFGYAEACVASAIALGAAMIGATTAVSKAMKLAPAVAMRPEAPPATNFSMVRLLRIDRIVSPLGQMIFSRLEANRRATLLSILGVALGTAVVVLGSFMEDTIDYVIEFEFQLAQRQDVTLTFRESRSISAVHDVEHLPGVLVVEPFRTVPTRIKHGQYHYRTGMMAIDENTQLLRVLDRQQRHVPIAPVRGLTISQKLSDLLHVREGDVVYIEILEQTRRTIPILVACVFPDYSAPTAYINRDVLRSILQEGDQVTGVFVRIDPAQRDSLFRAIKQIPNVAGILDNRAAMLNFRALVAESTRVMRIVNALFAAIIAFGVIFNGALISLAERGRDLATLRVMGYLRREVAFVLLGETAVVTLLAIPVGLPIGVGFSKLATMALDTESHRFPLVIDASTLSYAAIVILVTAILSAWIVRRMLDRLDLIAVLKVKE